MYHDLVNNVQRKPDCLVGFGDWLYYLYHHHLQFGLVISPLKKLLTCHTTYVYVVVLFCC